MPDPRRLIVFEAVVRAGSFSAAARVLHLSQPSVSRHVAALESECGLQLLERTSRGLRLTAAGNALLDHASASSQRSRPPSPPSHRANGVGSASPPFQPRPP